ARDIKRAVRPQVAAETIRGQRQIVIEADGKAPGARMLLDAGQLPVDLPLKILVKHYPTPMFLAEIHGFGRAGVLIWRRPVGPQPNIGLPEMQLLVERAVGGEFFQQVVLAIEKRLKFARPRRARPPFPKELYEEQ